MAAQSEFSVSISTKILSLRARRLGWITLAAGSSFLLAVATVIVIPGTGGFQAWQSILLTFSELGCILSIALGFRELRLFRLTLLSSIDPGPTLSEERYSLPAHKARTQAIPQHAAASADDIRKDQLLEARRPLLHIKFTRGLNPEEQRRLDDIDRQLDEIETAEADRFDAEVYPHTRAARLEANLDRLEAYVAAMQRENSRRS